MDETGRSLIPSRFRIEFLGRRREFIMLLNDCISPDQNGLRDSQPYLLGGLQMDHKNKSIALLNRQVRRIGTFKNSAYIICRHPAAAFEVRAVARKTSTSNDILHIKHRRQLVSQ